MKKTVIILIVFCIAGLSGSAFGQEEKKQDRKGGFSVGGYDNARQEKEKPAVTKRSVIITDEAEAAEKAVREEAVEAPKPEPAAAPPAQKPPEGNTYGKDKQGLEGKEFGQSRSEAVKEKQKEKKNTKAKTRRR